MSGTCRYSQIIVNYYNIVVNSHILGSPDLRIHVAPVGS
jgi:hypothetical protein